MKKEKIKKKDDNFKKWTSITDFKEDRRKNSSRMYTVGKNVAEAEKMKDRLELQLKQAKAKARSKWSKKVIGGKKLNIPSVDAKVEVDPTVMKAEEDLIDAKYFFNICKGAMSAMREKGQQLTNITNSSNAELKMKYVPKGRK